GVVVPLLVYGLPILDTLLSMVRRFVGGLKMIQPYKASLKQRVLAAKRMFEADQGHIHHRLIALGFSHRNAVLALYGIALGLSAMALLSVLAQYRNAGIILVAAVMRIRSTNPKKNRRLNANCSYQRRRVPFRRKLIS